MADERDDRRSKPRSRPYGRASRREVAKAILAAGLLWSFKSAAADPAPARKTYRGPFIKPTGLFMWDTLIVYHEREFHLIALIKNAAGRLEPSWLAVSRNGIDWTDCGQIGKIGGGVWRATGPDAKPGEFIGQTFHVDRGPTPRLNMTFATSTNLKDWQPLPETFDLRPNPDWYETSYYPKGRWDGMSVVPRPGEGYFAYWTAFSAGSQVIAGFGESRDGRHWTVLPPVTLEGVSLGHAHARSPEISSAYYHNGIYHIVAGLDDGAPTFDLQFANFRPGAAVFVSKDPAGPFRPAAKNHRLMVGNAAYWPKLIDTPMGVLVNHHSFETAVGQPSDVDGETTYLAPFKTASWDEEGILRLKWWPGNDKAKRRELALPAKSRTFSFDTEKCLIIEGRLRLTERRAIFIEGSALRGTAFFIHPGGLIEYGDASSDGSGFDRKGFVDRSLRIGKEARCRIVRKGRIVELYIDDVLMPIYCLPEKGAGRVAFLGDTSAFFALRAWQDA